MSTPSDQELIDVDPDAAYDAGYAAGRADVLENGDGFHTFDELYEARMRYHAAWVAQVEYGRGGRLQTSLRGFLPYIVKSWRHSDGELCFGGGWFIVVTTLPAGQISQHYKAEHWDLFRCQEVETPPTFDGHTPSDVLERLAHQFGTTRVGEPARTTPPKEANADA